MRSQTFMRPDQVEMLTKHVPGCGCANEDATAVVIDLRCVSGYLIDRPGYGMRESDFGEPAETVATRNGA